MKNKRDRWFHKEDGFYYMGAYMTLLIVVITIMIPIFLFSYEKRIYDIQKEHLLTCVDVSIYNTYVTLETTNLSQYNFDNSKSQLENIFRDAFNKTLEDKGHAIDTMAVNIKKFDYHSTDRVFLLTLEYRYHPICLKFLEDQIVLLELNYHIPTDK